MKPVTGTCAYGSTVIHYQIVMLPRKSLEIAVHPDQRVIIKAPLGLSQDVIAARVRKRALWITQQLAYFSQFEPRTPARRYVGGESHRYLGRQYRLKIAESDHNQVRLKQGYFCIDTTSREPEQIKRLIALWYEARASVVLRQIFDDAWEGFKREGIHKPCLKRRTMRTRWGSLSSKGYITLNNLLIQAPRACIEYVVIHELCHLLHHNHGPGFYRLLDDSMPDWVQRKQRLEMAFI